MPFSLRSSLSSPTYRKSPLNPLRWSSYTESSSTGSPLVQTSFLKPEPTGEALPESHTDIYSIWLHASYLFHLRRYASALLTFQYLIHLPIVPTYILRRLHINIGLTHLALHESASASEAFHTALALRESSNDEFITSPGLSGDRNTGKDVTTLILFLLGITNWKLGAIGKAHGFFNDCIELFDDCTRSVTRAFERITRYINFAQLGMPFVLDIGQPRHNSKQCAERIKLERLIHTKSFFKWELLGTPEDVLFEAEKVISESHQAVRGETDETVPEHHESIIIELDSTESEDAEGSIIDVYFAEEEAITEATEKIADSEMLRPAVYIRPPPAMTDTHEKAPDMEAGGRHVEDRSIMTTITTSNSSSTCVTTPKPNLAPDSLMVTTQGTRKTVKFTRSVEDLALARESMDSARGSMESATTRRSLDSAGGLINLTTGFLHLPPHPKLKQPLLLPPSPRPASPQGGKFPNSSSLDKPLPPLPLYAGTGTGKSPEIRSWLDSI